MIIECERENFHFELIFEESYRFNFKINIILPHPKHWHIPEMYNI